MWEHLIEYWQEITGWTAVLNFVLVVLTIGWVLTIKKDSMSATAWCLLVLLLPFLGPILFVLLGWQNVHRSVERKQKHKDRFRQRHATDRREARAGLSAAATLDTSWGGLARLAQRLEAFPMTPGNRVEFYYEGQTAFDAKLAAIRSARHHIHLEYFIIQPDVSGRLLLDELVKKARAGVEVRLLYDAMGSHRLHRWMLRPLVQAGGKFSAFLPLNLLRRRIQINMRNHRKILVVDGRVAFSGGLNIGDEYLGRVARFGYWRDTDMRIEGPAVAALQRIFIEDWDFACGENLGNDVYSPLLAAAGSCPVQVIHSGPDQELKSIREIYYAAFSRARERLWIASPYFVPDAGLHDALCLAAYSGIDVRLLCQFNPDKWIPYFAARYYFGGVLDAGVKVYQYTRGMMHSKVVLVDGQWASVGTANLDNRSMHLNFEVNCLFDCPSATAELEEAFRRDLQTSIRLERNVYAQRPFAGRLIDNASRLLSPIL